MDFFIYYFYFLFFFGGGGGGGGDFCGIPSRINGVHISHGFQSEHF